MLTNFKTTSGIALLLALSACASTSTKEKSPALPMQSLVTPTSPSDALNLRAQADYQFIMGDVLSREGKSARAIELFESVAKIDPAPAVYMRLSAEYQKTDNLKAAILNAEKASAKDPKNVDAHLILGVLYSTEKSYDQAIAQYNAVLHLQPKNSEAVIYIASLHAKKEDFKKAEEYFNSLLKNPNYQTPYLVHYYLGLMRLEQKAAQYETAAENEFKKSLRLDPGFEDAVVSLANLYQGQRNSARALALCQDFQKKQGFAPKVADLIAQIYVDNGEFDKAYKQFDYIISNSERSAETEMKMALILIKSKRYGQATEKLNDILARFPDADSARYYLAAVQEETGDAENAIRNYLLIPAASEHSSEATAHAAYLLKAQGKINQALALTAKGLTAKADPQVYIMHASLLDTKADYLGAARTLEQGLVKYSDNTDLRFQHAIMLDRLGKKDAMMAQMKKVLEIDPYHVQSMSYLAFTMAERNQDLTEAERLARQASELAPEDGYVLDTFGWVLFKQKKYSESIKVLEKAHAYQPNAKVIADHLASAHSMQTQSEKQNAAYNKSAANDRSESGLIHP